MDIDVDITLLKYTMPYSCNLDVHCRKKCTPFGSFVLSVQEGGHLQSFESALEVVSKKFCSRNL